MKKRFSVDVLHPGLATVSKKEIQEKLFSKVRKMGFSLHFHQSLNFEFVRLHHDEAAWRAADSYEEVFKVPPPEGFPSR